MPEKIVGLNKNVQVTDTLGAGGGCCWESLTFHRNACPPSSHVAAGLFWMPARARQSRESRGWAVRTANW